DPRGARAGDQIFDLDRRALDARARLSSLRRRHGAARRPYARGSFERAAAKGVRRGGPSMKRVFLLSPADCNGDRARWLVSRTARSDVAQKLRSPEGAPLGEVFTFLSALYFRGKLAYARAFARPPDARGGVFVITPTRGLVPYDAAIRLSTLRGFGRVPIHKDNPLYRRSLKRTARMLADAVGGDCEVVLLGSIATGKYLDVLQSVFGVRLLV